MKILGLGTTRVDLHLYSPYLPTAGAEVKLTDNVVKIGGSVLNTSLILHQLKANPLYYTQICNDDVIGLTIKAELHNIGLDKILPEALEGDLKNALSYIIILPNGERTIYSYDPSPLKIELSTLEKHYETTGAFYTSSYEFINQSTEHLIEVLKQFKNAGKKTFLDLSPLNHMIDRDCWERFLPYFSHITGTEDEFSVLKHIVNFNSFEKIINELPIEKLYIKKGAKGGELLTASDHYQFTPKPIKAENVTGCGDAFHAGVIYGEMTGLPDEKILQLANYFGGQVAKLTFIPKKVVAGYKEELTKG